MKKIALVKPLLLSFIVMHVILYFSFHFLNTLVSCLNKVIT